MGGCILVGGCRYYELIKLCGDVADGGTEERVYVELVSFVRFSLPTYLGVPIGYLLSFIINIHIK